MAENKPATSGVCTFSTVGASAASVTLLAADSRRKGASIINAGTTTLHVRMDGGTATITTGHNVQLASNAYFEVPSGYTGAISGIWAGAPTGSANMAEYV